MPLWGSTKKAFLLIQTEKEDGGSAQPSGQCAKPRLLRKELSEW